MSYEDVDFLGGGRRKASVSVFLTYFLHMNAPKDFFFSAVSTV